MKYMKRADAYKAANVTFFCTSTQAYSYDWWCFLKLIKGQLIFNNYMYSNSTRKHQYKVRSLLNELGLKIDREVQVKVGLQNIRSISELNKQENLTLAYMEIEQAAKIERRKAKARERRAAKKAIVPALSLVGV